MEMIASTTSVHLYNFKKKKKTVANPKFYEALSIAFLLKMKVKSTKQ